MFKELRLPNLTKIIDLTTGNDKQHVPAPFLDRAQLLMYFTDMEKKPGMRKKESTTQRGARDAVPDVTLQDIVDGVEDELLVIDSEYRVRFANSAARDRLQKGDKSLPGRHTHLKRISPFIQNP